MASEHGDGVSIAVREHGRTVAAVGFIPTRAVIDERRDELAAILTTAAERWA